MGHYIANLRDIEFCLFDLLQRDEILGKSIYKDLDRQTKLQLSLIQQPGMPNYLSHLKNHTKHLWIMSGGALMPQLN
jgi:hypothetical protein